MHLAGEARVVTGRAQVMGECRDVGRELRGIVVDRVRLGNCPDMKEARAGAQSGLAVYVLAKRTERFARAFRCGACRKSAGPSGKKVPLN